jgi:hypothetical protein
MENEFESQRVELAGLHDRHNVLLAHDDELLAVHLDFGAGVPTEENFVASFNVRGRTSPFSKILPLPTAMTFRE